MTSKAQKWADIAEGAGKQALAALILDHDNQLEIVLDEHSFGRNIEEQAYIKAELLYADAVEEAT